ncbi:MAG TPA: prolipoprotein diacylglyceryl transferase family protein [Solirubrobacteraceae bacterium]
MKPEVLIFGVSIKTFGVTFALGFLACGAIIARRLREIAKPVDWAYEIVFAALVGGLIGARGYFVVQNYGEVKHDLLGHIFSGSGLVWYGGAIGGAIAVVAWMRWRDMLNLVTGDMCATVLALGYGIGRIGCQVSGDGDYGIRSKAPWAMGYPHGTVPTPPGVTVQPTPIYETVSMCLLAYVLWHFRDRFRPGVIFGLYLVFSGLERLLVEFIRRNKEVFAGLTAPQLESIVLVVVGIALLCVLARGAGWAAPGGGLGIGKTGRPTRTRVRTA